MVDFDEIARDHERVEEMAALLSGMVIAFEGLMKVTNILADAAPDRVRDDVRPIMEAVRTVHLLGKSKARDIVNRTP